MFPDQPGLSAGISTFAHLLSVPTPPGTEAPASASTPAPAAPAPEAPPSPVQPELAASAGGSAPVISLPVSEANASNAQDATQAERARCAAIFQAPAAATRPDMAAHLAFNTSLSAAEAAAMLDVAAKGGSSRSTLSDRMARTPNPQIGTPAEPASGKTGLAALIAGADAKVVKSS